MGCTENGKRRDESTNLSLGSSGPSIVNREDEAFGAAALNHSLKGEEGLS